jgi:hypothetical protein
VHHDAQLAVIGIRLIRVKVGDLGHGQQRQQNKTQARDDGQEIPPRTSAGAQMCLEGCHRFDPYVLILQKNVLILTPNRG